jgi:NAD kinase
MNWRRFDSSVLRSAKYAADERILYLLFRSGELYSYLDFPPQQYHDFLAADSKGRYFSQKIRGRFRYKHLPRRRPPKPN